MGKDTSKENRQNKEKEEESSDVGKWFRDHADGLFRYSLLRVGDPEKAEDLVQETFLSAIQSRDSFAGRSSIRGWLLGILKNKIADYFRNASRDRRAKNTIVADDDIGEHFGMFCWNKGFGPKFWDSDPHHSLEDKRFLEAIHKCLRELPERLRKIFILREIEEFKTKEIEETIGAESGHIRVMLHRARVLLRSCVERLWQKDTIKGDME